MYKKGLQAIFPEIILLIYHHLNAIVNHKYWQIQVDQTRGNVPLTSLSWRSLIDRHCDTGKLHTCNSLPPCIIPFVVLHLDFEHLFFVWIFCLVLTYSIIVGILQAMKKLSLRNKLKIYKFAAADFRKHDIDHLRK